ncbi:MAG: sigma 54-interacting transcriptional regulator [Oscillibacter sp.]|nr:sigma 54-interacting transcriptional regulator [Oscillibacter sp.]
MATMAVLVPYQEMCPLAEEMFGAYPSLSRVCVEYVRNEQVESRARELEKQGCDILMARGLHAIRMKRAVKLPVVEIRVTAQELGELVLDLREELGRNRPKIGLLGFENMLCDTSRFDRLYDLELHRYLVSDTIDTENALRSAVRQAVREGCQAVLGGEVVCETAKELGLRHRFIPGSRESLRAAFEIAKHIGYAIDQEKSARAEIETMLDFALNGIVRVDQSGVVLRANASASRYAGRENAVGREITEAFPALKRDILDRVLREGEEAYSILMPSGGRELVVNAAPIRVDGKADGALFTFHEGQRVMQMSTELHHELYLRGYLADWRFESIPMQNKEKRRLLQKIRQVSKYGAPVLLTGEAGCGKQITAECIHNESFAGAFFSLDCRASRPETLDAMLFGNTPSDKSLCLVEAARNGTIYFAHVEFLSAELQYRLLRLIRGNFMRNGSNLPQETNVRIIASTNANLVARVEKGTFRSDLYYALNALGFTLPPLRECREDILPWVELFLNRWRKRYGRPVRLTQDAKDYLERYDWPGNLNQVNSVCEQMVLLAERRNVDEGFLRRQIERLTPKLLPGTEKIVLYRDERAVEIAELLKKYNGNRQKVADELGISKTTLWRHMKRYGIGKDFGY